MARHNTAPAAARAAQAFAAPAPAIHVVAPAQSPAAARPAHLRLVEARAQAEASTAYWEREIEANAPLRALSALEQMYGYYSAE